MTKCLENIPERGLLCHNDCSKPNIKNCKSSYKLQKLFFDDSY